MAYISGDESQVMDPRGCREESINDAHRAPTRLAFSDDSGPYVGNFGIDRYDSSFKALRELQPYPPIQAITPRTCGHLLYAVTQFGQCYHAQEETVFVGRFHPPDQASVGTGFDPFGNDVGIEKKIHRTILAGRDFSRRTFNPEPRKGDAAKNSAKFPTRVDLRIHSSAPTTTAVVRPLRVMVWGPCATARSITSLNFALASATVHVSAAMRHL